MSSGITLTIDELRAVTEFAAQCATDVLSIFDGAHPSDSRVRDAIGAAFAFADGGARTKRLRDSAFGANAAAREVHSAAAGHAARAAGHAAAAAFLHPLANATQVKHILGAAAHAALAAELTADSGVDAATDLVERARRRASPTVVDVLRRYPRAPSGGGRAGELLRDLDSALRAAHVRLATIADLPAIAQIVSDAYQPYVSRIGRQPAPMATDHHLLITTSDHVRVLVVDDAVVGVLTTVVHTDHLFVENVAVAPHAQGRGYGRCLLEYAEYFARSTGLAELRLYTNAAMTENVALYQRLGYVEVDRRMDAGFDRVHFVKTINSPAHDVGLGQN